MSAGEISSLVVAVVAVLGALTAYLKAHTTANKLQAHLDDVKKPPPVA
jgi:hypothetical protein